MCTAVRYLSGDLYFGRTLDNDCSYREEVVITPRRREIEFKHCGRCAEHYAMVGMACVMDGYPMYYDAINEKGVGMAGLNFVGNAVYSEPCKKSGATDVAVFEFIPWLLGRCASVAEARKALASINLVGTPFKPEVPAAQLHWMVCDAADCITVERTADGLHVYDNKVGVLTNNPPFPQQLCNLSNYMHLSPRPPRNEFSDKFTPEQYSRGMGAIGLPGDLSSESRFVRAAFTALNSPCREGGASCVNQFFHILGAVGQTLGSCILDNGKYETTIYTSCCNATRGIYYYTGYDNHRISAVDMHRVDLDGTAIIRYPLVHGEQIYMQN